MQKQISVLNLSNYLNEQKHISTFQTTSTNKNKSPPSKLPQRILEAQWTEPSKNTRGSVDWALKEY
jgi:hypothetical protein